MSTTSIVTNVAAAAFDRFKGKTAIVTGAGSGICQAVVLRLVAEGASVLGIDINENGLKETQQLASHPERVSFAVVSVADEEHVTQKVNEYIALQGRLDVLVNGAGFPSEQKIGEDGRHG